MGLSAWLPSPLQAARLRQLVLPLQEEVPARLPAVRLPAVRPQVLLRLKRFLQRGQRLAAAWPAGRLPAPWLARSGWELAP